MVSNNQILTIAGAINAINGNKLNQGLKYKKWRDNLNGYGLYFSHDYISSAWVADIGQFTLNFNPLKMSESVVLLVDQTRVSKNLTFKPD